MNKHIVEDQVPDQYAIFEQDGERFILAQPNGEKIIVHQKPSASLVTAVAVLAGLALVSMLAVWLAHNH